MIRRWHGVWRGLLWAVGVFCAFECVPAFFELPSTPSFGCNQTSPIDYTSYSTVAHRATGPHILVGDLAIHMDDWRHPPAMSGTVMRRLLGAATLVPGSCSLCGMCSLPAAVNPDQNASSLLIRVLIAFFSCLEHLVGDVRRDSEHRGVPTAQLRQQIGAAAIQGSHTSG